MTIRISVEDLQRAGELLSRENDVELWGNPQEQFEAVKLAKLEDSTTSAALGFLQQGVVNEFKKGEQHGEEIREFALKHHKILLAWIASSVMIGIRVGILAVRINQGEVDEIWKS